MRSHFACLALMTITPAIVFSADDEISPPTASELLDRSIAYHDPHSRWSTARFRLELEESRPDGGSRHTHLEFSNALRSFELVSDRDGSTIEGLMADPGWDCVWTLDGSTDFTDTERDEYELTCERLEWLRDYYTYLWGLPMKLRDPGTLLDPTVVADSYDGLPVWRLRVTYDEAVGSDTWYFYFDRQTSRLSGYRFYHDESRNDGEYILLAGEIETQGMKIPRRRSWYTHSGNRHLGDDVLVELQIDP